MQQLKAFGFKISLALIALLLVLWVLDFSYLLAPLALCSALFLAFGIAAIPQLKNYQYTAWILVAIVSGLLYPNAFLKWGSIDLRNKWLILVVVQIVMFGMGTQMSIKDFLGIKTMGKGVLVGILCQFSIMPIAGYLLTRVFNFEPEIAAGVILIGSCSSGLASNVMVYLAKANLTLSITLTAVATLCAPLMTPLMMKLLAGTYIEIDFVTMCIQIIKIVIVPIGAALLFDAYSQGSTTFKSLVNKIFIVALLWLTVMILGGWQYLAQSASENVMVVFELLNFMFGAIVVGVAYSYVIKLKPSISKLMPLLSMAGIVYFTTVTTAASRDNILSIGIVMLLVSMLHNALGYTMGYWLSRLLGLDKNSCRTVALEVGLQNGGMASGLAGAMGKLGTVGLASAIFSPWMNISGSILANYWKKHSVTSNTHD